MRKYLSIFKISFEKQLEYRFNFFMGRLRSIIILLLLYYVWTTLSAFKGQFAGYTANELITYVFIVNILRSLIFGSQSRLTAEEINDGTFSIYLVKPVNHFFYIFFRELAERVTYFTSAILEVIIFAFILRAKLFWQTDFKIIILFFFSFLLAFFLYFLLTYLGSILTFWLQHVGGPRFLFEWILEFASGAYFPLNILPAIIFFCLSILPFYYLIYFPLTIYLGRLNFNEMIIGLLTGIVWLAILGMLVRLAWVKGLKKYSGEGI